MPSPPHATRISADELEEAEVSYPIKKVLTSSKTVAIVGLPPNPSRTAQGGRYLSEHGYEIIPSTRRAGDLVSLIRELRELPFAMMCGHLPKAEFVPEIVGCHPIVARTCGCSSAWCTTRRPHAPVRRGSWLS
jgi:hypothetical protein